MQLQEIKFVTTKELEGQLIKGMQLYQALQITTPYHKWILRMIEHGKFEENFDYISQRKLIRTQQGNFSSRTEHIMTIDMAKEIAMIQKNDIGKQVRKYFIEAERKLKNQGIALLKDEEVPPELLATQRMMETMVSLWNDHVNTKKKLNEVEGRVDVVETKLTTVEEENTKLRTELDEVKLLTQPKEKEIGALNMTQLASEYGIMTISGNPHPQIIRYCLYLAKVKLVDNQEYDGQDSQTIKQFNENGEMHYVIYIKHSGVQKLDAIMCSSYLKSLVEEVRYKRKSGQHKAGDFMYSIIRFPRKRKKSKQFYFIQNSGSLDEEYHLY